MGAQNEKIPNMDIQQTLYNSHSHKGFFFTKRFFPIVNVFTTLFNWSHQEADYCKKTIYLCLFAADNFSLQIMFTCTEQDRGVVMTPIFGMDTSSKVQLCTM